MSNRINRARRHSAAQTPRPTATRTPLAVALLVALSGTGIAASDAASLESPDERVSEQAVVAPLSDWPVMCSPSDKCAQRVHEYLVVGLLGDSGDLAEVDYGQGSIALGVAAQASGGGVSMGAGAQAAARAIAIGTEARTGDDSVAVGSGTYAKQLATAIGTNASANGVNSVAIGAGSIANTANTVSFGSSGNERRLVNVAAGSALTDAVNVQQLNAVADANLVVYRDDLDKKAIYVGESALGDSVEFAGINGARRLSGVRSGTVAAGSSEAVNGSQLFSTNSKVSANESSITTLASSLGDLDGRVTIAEGDLVNVGDRVTTNEGNITTLTGSLGDLDGRVTTAEGDLVNVGDRVTINEGSITTLTSSLGDLDGRVTVNEGDIIELRNRVETGEIGLVTYDDASGTVNVAAGVGGASINLAGTDGARVLDGVAAGELSAGSTQAVNGAQLFATNARVSTNTTDITALTTKVNLIGAGGLGLVTFDDGLQVVNVADGMGGTRVEFAGVDGARVLAGVADGELSAASDEAVNGAQLHATNEDVADNALAIDALDGRVTTNEGDIIALDGRVGVNEDDIKALSGQITDLTDGSAGLVTHDAVTGITSVAGGKGGDVIDMRGTDGLRRLSGVADGIDAQDAVTVAQLRAVGLVDPVTGMPLNALTYDDLSLGRVSLGGAQGTIIDNLADGRIAFDSREAINGGQLALVMDGIQKTINEHGDRLTELNEALANHLIEGEPGPVEGGANGGGSGAYNAENGSIAIGDGDKAGAGSIELGQGAVADGGDQVAIGHDAQAGGTEAVAIGNGASASGNNAVAIGAGSVADRDNTVAVGSAGNERVISHVADGVQATDAVNLRQLDDRFQQSIAHTEQRFHTLDQRIDRMASLSAAYAGMALNTAGLEGRNRVGVGIGAQNGKEAMAVGYQRVMGKRNNISVSLGGAFSGSETSVSAGAGLSW